MARTIPEVEADLATINAAIETLVKGERLIRLQLGSGEFARTYEFQELTYENLLAERARLQDELASLQPAVTVRYRKDSTLPLQVRKFNTH